MPSITVVGGGAAGIAAAMKAGVCGWKVTLCEAQSTLGGRLGSFKDTKSGAVFDYGEHLLTGGYRDTLELLRMIGAENSVSFQKKLDIPYYHPARGRFKLKTGNLPRPLNFISAILNFRLLSLKQRFKLIARIIGLLSSADDTLSIEELLKNADTEEREYFWTPFILSTLNCLPGEADAGLLKTVIREGFLAGGGMGFFWENPRTVFHDRALEKLRETGVDVKLKCKINAVKCEGDRILSAGAGDDNLVSDKYIFALQPDVLANLLKNNGIEAGKFGLGSTTEYAGICNVHFVVRNELFPDSFGCLVDSLPQWFFSRKINMYGRQMYHYNLVISAAEELISEEENIWERCLADLKKLGVDLSEEGVEFSRIIRDKKATVKLDASFPRGRAGPKTGLENCYIAGDWTNTGLPATIESAVRSGFAAVAAADSIHPALPAP